MARIILILDDSDDGGCAVDVEFCPPLSLPLTPAQRVAETVLAALKETHGATESADDA